MKKILPNQDVDFRIEILDNDNLINYNVFDSYKVTAYTTNLDEGVILDRTRINDYEINIKADEIANMKNGILKLKYEMKLNDAQYVDGVYSKTGEIITRYFVDLGQDNNENNGIGCRCNCC